MKKYYIILYYIMDNDYAPLTRSYQSKNKEMYDLAKPYKVPQDHYTKIALRDYNTHPSKVAYEYFSVSNIKRLQQIIKDETYKKSFKKFNLVEDQNVLDLIQVMRNIYTDYGKDLPDNVIRQVKKLNKYTVLYIVPNIINNLKQYYGYLNDINKPINPIELPLNVNNAGRLQLPGIADIYKL